MRSKDQAVQSVQNNVIIGVANMRNGASRNFINSYFILRGLSVLVGNGIKILMLIPVF